MMYELKIMNGFENWAVKGGKEISVGRSTTIENARKRAVEILIQNDVKGQIINIYKGGTWTGTVSMQTGSDEYVKPSIGLRRGIAFMYDDGDVFYTCYRNGKIKRW